MPTSKAPPLPDVSRWQPRSDATESLATAFLRRCQNAEQLIKLKAQQEIESNIDSFDSGAGIEDVVREQLSSILPSRYSIRAGVVNDSCGQTGGDYDAVIFNSSWFPEIKAGATSGSRRTHFPIEGVYGVGEIKQSLNFKSLDMAMEKLVVCHRLSRPPTSAARLSENRDLDHCPHGLTNPLYSFILATRLSPDVEANDIITRFVEINQHLLRLEVIRALCIIDVGTVHWVLVEDNGAIRPASFMSDDLFEIIQPGLQRVPECPSAFYALIQNLLLHLFRSVLAPEDIPTLYGLRTGTISIPNSDNWSHSPYSRPVNSPGLPYNYEWNPLMPAEVGPHLGAHKHSVTSEDDDTESGA